MKDITYTDCKSNGAKKRHMVGLNAKDIVELADNSKRLVQDNEYYKYIFKKTEKIVSVVFYVLHHTSERARNEVHVKDIEAAAQRVHNAIIASLEARTHDANGAVHEAAITLVALESKLRVAHVAGLIQRQVVELCAAEIQTVLRAMQNYIQPSETFHFENESETTDPLAPAQATAPGTIPTAPAPARSGTPAPREPAPRATGTERRERIRTIVQAKGNVTIKDISDIITDCSEKTIQRELNDMIRAGEVIREGKRRWSTYRLAN